MNRTHSDKSPPSAHAQFGMWLFPLFALGLFLTLIQWYQPQGVVWEVDWVPSLGINLSFRLDGIAFLFAFLISGVGVLIQIYALAYLRKHRSRFSFHLYLTLFMLAMLGVVMSDNIVLLFVFWELTTITSYLLIGFNHEQAVSRINALQSLIVTGSGGLALLAGLILLGEMGGSYQLSALIERAPELAEHAWFVPSLILVLLGAFTKSAQFPFHFWLPNAMAAPTPVSAYLHSATMVKAGVYLLAVVAPIYSQTPLWFYSLTLFGAVTALWCALLALKQTDLKLMLAYSTNVALGKLVLLIGIGSELALTAALLFILAHALYKAALFMVVGNIDKATATRDIRALHGLKSLLVISFLVAIVAAASKAGIPPMLGFLSKEYMYKGGLEQGFIVAIVLFLVNVTMVALALALTIKPFLPKQNAQSLEAKPVESQLGLWVPCLILALASVVVPIFGLDWVSSMIVTPGVLSATTLVTEAPLKLWQGFNLPLLLSALTLIAGIVLYRCYPALRRMWRSKVPVLTKAEQFFDRTLSAVMSFADWQTSCLQHKRLSMYALLFFTVLAAGLLSQWPAIAPQHFQGVVALSFYEWIIAAMLVLCALVCIVSRSRLLAVAALGVIGFLTTLVFMLYSAPDVAKTLLLVETLMVVFVVLLLRRMPKLDSVPNHSVLRRVFHGVVAATIGVAVTSLLVTITASPLDASLATFFAENSVAGGHGRNIVNVILVDFRAIDTLGEVVVVVIASIAAVSLLQTHLHKRDRIHSLIFATTAHIVAALMLVFSVYLLLRGHNQPGGGFIGALIAVIGFALLMFAESPAYVRERIRFSPFAIGVFGVLLSIVAGLFGLAAGLPFLTGLWWKELLPLGTPLLFDLGIYLAIVGGVIGMMLRLNEELD